jgi:hypothetical protein
MPVNIGMLWQVNFWFSRVLQVVGINIVYYIYMVSFVSQGMCQAVNVHGITAK